LQRIELNAIPQLEAYTFLIGPEGDFSEKEIQNLSDMGIKAVSLGNQRLRTETAGIFVAAWNYNNLQ
jgi:RNA methyltransferase, RsmE family